MGPIGSGILFCDGNFCEKVEPLFAGAGSMVLAEFDEPEYPFRYNKGASRFECSSLNILAVSGLSEAMKGVHQMGMADVERRVLEHADFLYAELERLGYVFYFDGKDSRSAIVSARHPEYDTAALMKHLASRNVECSLWYGYLRFSPHFYNTSEELERLIQILTEFKD